MMNKMTDLYYVYCQIIHMDLVENLVYRKIVKIRQPQAGTTRSHSPNMTHRKVTSSQVVSSLGCSLKCSHLLVCHSGSQVVCHRLQHLVCAMWYAIVDARSHVITFGICQVVCQRGCQITCYSIWYVPSGMPQWMLDHMLWHLVCAMSVSLT